jgi:hypothetical protein
VSLAYTTYINTIATLAVATTGDVNFTTILPSVIDYAEQRCYRDLDLQNTVVRQTTTLTAGTRTIGLPTSGGTFVVVDEINVITPSTATTADSGTRNPMMPLHKESLDYMWPSVTGSTAPTYFAMITDGTAIVGPWPDATYTIEVVGTVRPAKLSTAVLTTVLTWYFPDLFVAASMVYVAGYQRDFGAQVDDPKIGVSWEMQYQALLKGAQVEETRKKFGAEGWSPKQPDPIATPPRT